MKQNHVCVVYLTEEPDGLRFSIACDPSLDVSILEHLAAFVTKSMMSRGCSAERILELVGETEIQSGGTVKKPYVVGEG